jgi:signal transduction histidine kinase
MTTALRQSGIEPVGEMPWGTHFCHFYETRDDLLQTLLPFFKAGLESGEFCAWVVSEPLTETEVWHALDEAVPGLSRYVSDDSIEVLNARDVYLAGGEIDLHRIIGNWSATLERALSRGYQGIRVSGNTAWLEQKQWREFMEYEAELNRGIHDHPMLVLCTYPLATCGASEFLDVTGTHQFAVAKRRGRWEVVETPQLAQAKAEIARLNRELEQRVLERTMQLEAAMVDQRQAWSALQETQKALAHVSRLSTISELTASLAHEVNQPLTAIRTNATASLRWLDRTPPAFDEATEAMRRVIRDAERAADVIAHARALVKKSDGERTLVDVNQMIRELLGFVQPVQAPGRRGGGPSRRSCAGAGGPDPAAAVRAQRDHERHRSDGRGDDTRAPAGDLVRAWARRSRPRRPRRSTRRGKRCGGARPRAALRSFFHHQAQRSGHGIVDRPFHRPGSRRAAVGSPQRGPWVDLLPAASGDDPIAV